MGGPYHIPSLPTRNARMGMSEEELQGLKYRRMRELNNQASKACRAKRKNKQQAMEEELVVEQEKNLRLRLQLEIMEEKCEKGGRGGLGQAVPLQKDRRTARICGEQEQSFADWDYWGWGTGLWLLHHLRGGELCKTN